MQSSAGDGLTTAKQISQHKKEGAANAVSPTFSYSRDSNGIYEHVFYDGNKSLWNSNTSSVIHVIGLYSTGAVLGVSPCSFYNCRSGRDICPAEMRKASCYCVVVRLRKPRPLLPPLLPQLPDSSAILMYSTSLIVKKTQPLY